MAWLPQVAQGVGVFALIYMGAIVARALAHRWMRRRQIRGDMALLVDRTIYYGLLGIALLAGLSFGLQNTQVAFNSVLVAALLTGLGLQDLFKNYVSGFYILFERNVKPGDLIESQGYAGVVTDVKLRTTLLRSVDGELIVIPNSDLFTKPVKVGGTPPKPAAKRLRKRSEDDPDEGVEPVTL